VACDPVSVYLEKAAENDLDRMDNATYEMFMKHLEKIEQMPPRRHLKFGVPVHVDHVGQGRIIYQVEDEAIYIIRCFTDHKDYEKWYKSLK
jgi:mRNA-degrading endonuclease RelE of RelBE toxin-antitoxin system